MFMAVREEVRGRGVSTHLAEYAIDMAREKGIRKISISVVDSNEEGKAFLSRLGFISEGRDLRELNIDGSFVDGERFALLID